MDTATITLQSANKRWKFPYKMIHCHQGMREKKNLIDVRN